MRVHYICCSLTVLFFLATDCSPGFHRQKTRCEYRNISNVNEIITIQDTVVLPVVYKNPIELSKLSISERKQKFIDIILPSILIVRFDLEQKIKRIDFLEKKIAKGYKLTHRDSSFLSVLLNEFQTQNLKELKIRMKPHPVSITLAQAALESGWGTSRFFREGNNIFGVWSFDPNDQRLEAAIRRDEEQVVYLRKFENFQEAIQNYYATIGRVSAYKAFREARLKENLSPEKMIKFLDKYSEMGEDYVDLLRGVMRTNNLTRYDNYTIDQAFIYEDNETKWYMLNS